jgi:hypothetical protein
VFQKSDSTSRLGTKPLFAETYQTLNCEVFVSKYNVLSVIDWRHAGTIPRERAEIAHFLWTLPPAMDLPESYGADGMPMKKRSEENRRAEISVYEPLWMLIGVWIVMSIYL